ncbi:hypothetical protein EGW08_016127 [Elysia chlorotica]|uniref:Uncharacterized protein n=1 Tax=Elysia chlorotica TaxID=188477 RepID=A0A433T3I9_ELYCH|nr:hypothetical protein EGW08_016127 [Elysia chlorotica]
MQQNRRRTPPCYSSRWRSTFWPAPMVHRSVVYPQVDPCTHPAVVAGGSGQALMVGPDNRVVCGSDQALMVGPDNRVAAMMAGHKAFSARAGRSILAAMPRNVMSEARVKQEAQAKPDVARPGGVDSTMVYSPTPDLSTSSGAWCARCDSQGGALPSTLAGQCNKQSSRRRVPRSGRDICPLWRGLRVAVHQVTCLAPQRQAALLYGRRSRKHAQSETRARPRPRDAFCRQCGELDSAHLAPWIAGAGGLAGKSRVVGGAWRRFSVWGAKLP